jgi:phosphomannomutase
MIVFGTDGWRGIIAEDYTFENVRIVALATAKYILAKDENKKNPSVVIGYDTRFMSKDFAKEVALILASNNIIVHLTDDISSTPQVSYHTKQKGADLGIVITASHNPPKYNGYKVKGSFGGPATPEEISELETFVKKIEKRPPVFKTKDFSFYEQSKLIRTFNAKDSFYRYIKKKIDLDAINKAKIKVCFDPMHGAGFGSLGELINNVTEIHGERNPGFGEVDHPEPIFECLGTLISTVKKGKFNIGLATDGDADRLGAVDEDGNFVDSHRIFMILLKYLYEVKKKKGAVAKTVSLTSMVNAYCEKNNIPLFETAVGFKYISRLMNNEKILIGGEESGGLGTIIHIPERDGVFNGLLLLEVIAKTGKSLKKLCQELDKEFGNHRYQRRDVYVSQAQKKAILNACQKEPKQLGKYKVNKIQTTDGYKFFVDNGWLLIRASGTEPLIRFYAEAESISKVTELLDEGFKLK